eukprot:CAMPEP_0115866402 /NCGR_PEP_ID=MMETSP0287-20121206/20228_1 /TAXON_ID=412157 /ORGANISM="Chrysochromulina rotalis, Strain UIO044" /LENGTH=178 /DNA_ID=CAMNT_0003320963 /DNA_START=206 /DNA_END=739 /DNA_ORIENTATION=-
MRGGPAGVTANLGGSAALPMKKVGPPVRGGDEAAPLSNVGGVVAPVCTSVCHLRSSRTTQVMCGPMAVLCWVSREQEASHSAFAFEASDRGEAHERELTGKDSPAVVERSRRVEAAAALNVSALAAAALAKSPAVIAPGNPDSDVLTAVGAPESAATPWTGWRGVAAGAAILAAALAA